MPFTVVVGLIVASVVSAATYTLLKPRSMQMIPMWITVAILGFLATKYAPNMAQGEERESSAPSESDDDIKPRPHPNWKLLDEQWDGHFERPIAPAQRVKVPCRLYNQDPQREGDGIIRRLSPVDLYKEDCDKLRRAAR